MNRPALNDRQLARMVFRLELFQRRGLTEQQADRAADRLADRDYEKDDRRLCIECSNLKREWQCKRGGWVQRDLLQRCEVFNWETPKQ